LILISAFLVLRRRVWGICLYWAVLLATFAWSLWEVGLDGWALMPRLVYLAVAAFALLLLDFAPFRRSAALLLSLVLVAVGGAVFLTSRDTVIQADAVGTMSAASAADGEWA